MRFLPRCSTSETAVRLPLADASAAALAGCLVADDSPDARSGVVAAAERDPCLLLWLVLAADACATSPPRTASEAVERVVARGRQWLRWPAAECKGAQPLPEPDQEAWVDRVALAVETATLARQIALASDTAPPDEVYLAGMLRDALAWPSSPGHSSAPVILPAWLREAIEPAPPPTSGMPTSLAECLALAGTVVAGNRAGRQGLRLNRRAARERAQDARAAWTQTASGASGWLPCLAEKLARGHALEVDFQRRLEAEKLAALAEFAAGAGHEINNPLAVISGRAQLFLRDEPDPERRRELAVMNSQALRIHEMIADLMLFARPPQSQLELVNLGPLVERLAAELAPLAIERGIQITTRVEPPSLTLRADPIQLLVALRALADNSLAAVGQDGRIEITARLVPPSVQGVGSLFREESQTTLQKPLPEKDSRPPDVEIVVRDNGPGIAPEARRHLFDPFYSGRPAGRGLGMGLSKCWRIVGLHGGRIEVDSLPPGGAEFTLRLPVAGPASNPSLG